MRALIALSGCLILTGCGRAPDSVATLASGDVDTMKARIYNRHDGGPDVEQFEVAPDDYEKLLGLLRNGMRDSKPMKWQVLGDVQIKTRGGQHIDIQLFRTHTSPGAFWVNRTYYRGSGDDEILTTLLACHRRVKE